MRLDDATLGGENLPSDIDKDSYRHSLVQANREQGRNHYEFPHSYLGKPRTDAASLTNSKVNFPMPDWPGNNSYGNRNNVHVQLIRQPNHND